MRRKMPIVVVSVLAAVCIAPYSACAQEPKKPGIYEILADDDYVAIKLPDGKQAPLIFTA